MLYESGGELKHYGIFGMRWGVRRYQYPDGTYTPEGLRRRRKGNLDYIKNRDLRNLDPQDLTDEELKTATARLKLEDEFSSARNNYVSRGAKAVATTAAVMTGVVAIATNLGKLIDLGKPVFEKFKDAIIDRAAG